MLIVISTVFTGSGLTGTAQAQAERGAIPSVSLDSNEPGQLVITRQTPDLAPTDYRISWAHSSLGFLSYRDSNEAQRGNAYPSGNENTLTLDGLTPGEIYKVQLRARYYAANRSAHEWSGPWTGTSTTRVMDEPVKPPPPEETPQPAEQTENDDPPAAPTGLTVARVGHSVLTLTWNDPQDERITGYRVLRGASVDSLSTIEENTGGVGTEYADDTVAPETTYHYAVIALSAVGDGAQSDAVSATTTAAPKPKKQPTPESARQSTTPTDAQTVTTFISNTGQTSGRPVSSVRATAFTTGTGTYTLSSVGIFIPSAVVGTPAVKIYGDTGGFPGTLLATMTNPGTFEIPAVNSFTAPANTTLSASTTYWVVTSNSAATNGQGFWVSLNRNRTPDSGAAAGWSIGASRSKADIAATSWRPSSSHTRFEIRGTTDTTPPTLTSATVTGGGKHIELQFSENIPLLNQPPGSAFTVTADGVAVTTPFSPTWAHPLTPDLLRLQVRPVIFQGQAVVVTYTDPTAGDDANAIQDTAGNDAATFTTGMDGVPAVTNNSTVTNTPATGAPTITGTAQVGQTLTAGTTAIMDAEGLTSVSYTYQWIRTTVRVDTNIVDTNISGATASTYTLVAADLGTTIKVRVSFTDDASNAETLTSAATAVVSAANNPPTVATAIPDQSATAGTAFSYAFPANTFSDADTGDKLSYTATKADGTALPTWLAFTARTRTFSGTPQAADTGTVSVKVTASDGNGGSVSDTFDITVAADTTPPTLTGATVIGGGKNIELQFSENIPFFTLPPGSAFTVTADGVAVTTPFSPIWAHSSTPDLLLLRVSPVILQGQAVVVTYTDPTAGDDANAIQDTAGNDAATFTTGMDGVPAVTNNSTVTNTPATGAPTITGTAQVGQTLTAGTTAIMDADGLTSVSYTYQWIRTATGVDTNISGATASTYTLVAADLGTTVKVRVSFTDDASTAETLTSAATAAVSAVVPADWTLKPTAVAAGDKFRLLFLSSTRRNASSTDIATYNTFIQTRAAAGHTDIRAYSTGFRAVGCTAAVDARDNTKTTYTTTDKGVPIYWLNGAKAADQYEDFYDGSWDDEANNKNESGTNGLDTSLNDNYPLTGCSHDGTEQWPLGASQVSVGRPNSSGSGHGPLFANAQVLAGRGRPQQPADGGDRDSGPVGDGRHGVLCVPGEHVHATRTLGGLPGGRRRGRPQQPADGGDRDSGPAGDRGDGVQLGSRDGVALSFLPPHIRQGQAVVVTYTDPTGGNDTAAFRRTPFSNDAPPSPPA